MLRMRKIGYTMFFNASILIVLTSALGVTPRTRPIPGMVFGPPAREVVLRGSYVAALSIAYQDWKKRVKGAKIEDQKITVTPLDSSGQLYVRFVPRQGINPVVGCTTDYGAEILYVINERKRKVVRADSPC